MYTEAELQREIAMLVNGAKEEEIEIFPDSLALQVIINHLPEFKRGEGFVEYCAWASVRKIVGDYVNKLVKNDDGDIVQEVLPGFKHVQRYYIVERSGTKVAVPTMRLTYDEGMAIVRKLRSEAETKRDHADELEQLLRSQIAVA